MSDVSDKLFDYLMNARATTSGQGYVGSNRADAPNVNAWTAVKVDSFFATSPNFAAQAYTDGQGNYRISIRPSQSLGDWISTNKDIGSGNWNAEFSDAIRFYGELILQVKATPEGRRMSLDDIRNSIDGSGFSQGATLIEAASKFWGTRGMGVDGPGAAAQINLPEFAALKDEFRARGLSDLQDHYNWNPGDFQMRQYTYIGRVGENPFGVDVFTSSKLENLNAAFNDWDAFAYRPSKIYPEFALRGTDGLLGAQLGFTTVEHDINRIAAAEGFLTLDALAQERQVTRNLAQGLSATGYQPDSVQYERLGGSGMAFQVTVYRSVTGQMVEVRVPGRSNGGTFEALGPPISSTATAAGRVVSIGISDPAALPIQTGTPLDPDGLDTPSRDSASYITIAGANEHRAVIDQGGTLSDLWVLQKNASNGFTNASEFYKAVQASNPGVVDINKIPAGQTIYLPEKMGDGSVTYHYAGGTSINNNPASGEYHMVVPNAEGGHTIYSRTADGDAGYTVRQVSTNAAGATTYEFTGYQDTLNADVRQFASQTTVNRDLNGDGQFDQTQVAQSDGAGNQTVDTKNFDSEGDVQNEVEITQTANGQVSATVSGVGAEVNLDNANVTLAAGAQAKIDGENVTFVGGAGSVVETRNGLKITHDDEGNPLVSVAGAPLPANMPTGGLRFVTGGADGQAIAGTLSALGQLTLNQPLMRIGNALQQLDRRRRCRRSAPEHHHCHCAGQDGQVFAPHGVPADGGELCAGRAW